MRVRIIVLAAATAALLASGCGAIADEAAEQAGEEVGQAATGCENIDVDNENVSAECGDQNFKVNADGDGEVPDSFPVELSALSDARINGSSETTANGEQQTTLQATTDRPVSEVVDSVKSDLNGAGYTQDSDITSSGNGGETANVAYSKGDTTVNVTAGSVPGQDETQITAAATQVG